MLKKFFTRFWPQFTLGVVTLLLVLGLSGVFARPVTAQQQPLQTEVPLIGVGKRWRPFEGVRLLVETQPTIVKENECYLKVEYLKGQKPLTFDLGAQSLTLNPGQEGRITGFHCWKEERKKQGTNSITAKQS